MSNHTNETPKSFEQIKQELYDKWFMKHGIRMTDAIKDLDALLVARNEQVDVWGDDKDGQYHKMYIEKLKNKFDKECLSGFNKYTVKKHETVWQWILDNCLSPATKTREVSDEEMQKEASVFDDALTFIEGAKWMRDKLTNNK